ncbi:entericidin A/B family lipoprotein [Bordetella genomosp. 13]|uniref:Entericidin n=1 Tax=Bordetella genomosp. 13 TaxID=463040 RepID=A0A1W6ZBA1_9BORD|nr:entericidin A/B family lipoprotein [Bordetella genomosp. 13]ARP94668.1 entericidin [Bordetella genomosp. 13]
MRTKFMLTALVVFGLVLQGCNTVSGMGKDIQRAGSAISNAADR